MNETTAGLKRPAVFLLLIVLSSIFFGPKTSFAQESGGPPNFQDFPVIENSGPADVKIDFKHGVAKKYKTQIQKALAHGPNFAGHYVVVEYGCGSQCSNLVLVNAKTGTVNDPGNLNLGQLKYHVESRLLKGVLACEQLECPTRYFVVENNDELHEVH